MRKQSVEIDIFFQNCLSPNSYPHLQIWINGFSINGTAEVIFRDNEDMARLCEAFQGEINLLKHGIEEKDQRIKALEEKLEKHQDAY